MSKIVYNIPRNIAQSFSTKLEKDKNAWISIHEPGKQHISNIILDGLPNLKISFWDVQYDNIPVISKWPSDGEFYSVITDEQIKDIYSFLIENQNRNLYINCRMGVSRSAAISKFCVDYLEYEWDSTSKFRADINNLIYKKLVDYHSTQKNPV